MPQLFLRDSSSSPVETPDPAAFDLALSLLPYSQGNDTEKLWKVLQKLGGLDSLFYDTSEKHRQAKRQFQREPLHEDLYRQCSRLSFLIRWIFIPLCWIEARFHEGGSPVPRELLLVTVERHFRLFSSLRAMGS